MIKIIKTVCFVCALVLAINTLGTRLVRAGYEELTVRDGADYRYDEFNLYCGDYGRFVPDDKTYIDDMTFRSSDNSVLSLDSDGNYQALAKGNVIIFVEAQDQYGEIQFEASYSITVATDYSSVQLEKNNITLYYAQYGYALGSLKLITDLDLSECYFDWTYQTGSATGNFECDLDRKTKTLNIAMYSSGTRKIVLTIGNKTLDLTVTAKKFSINKTSSLLVKGKKTTIKLKNGPANVRWKTTNKKVASVSAKGVIKGKKVGNAVIYAVVDHNYVGCAVSVIKPKMKKIIKKAKSLFKGKYSQARRMQKGYYDCSSLVWRSYASAKIYLGNRYYAPVAADLAKKYKKKKIKGGLKRKTLNKMKYRVGDLLFREGAKNGRYRGIYHVEMFVGYNCLGCDAKGKPVLEAKWATVRNDYYPYDGGMMVRPWK